MKRMLLLLILVACTYDPQGARYVIDGDTFVLNNGEKVRLQGIDTPEKGDVNYDRAGYELQRRLVGRELKLEGEGKDKYNRILRHVFAEGVHVNLELVREGWARAYLHKGTKYEALLEQAQEEARKERKGIWKVNDKQYLRLSSRCLELGCPLGTITVASKYGEVFYNCVCSAVLRIAKENLVCFEEVQDAIAEGLRETRRC